MPVRNPDSIRAPPLPAADRRGTQSGKARSESNRRRYPRILAPIHCRQAGVEFFAQHLEPIDIGLGGLRIQSHEEYRVGALLPLDIAFARIAPVTFNAEIMWTEALRAGEKGRFDVGLAFVDLTQRALKVLLTVLASERDPASEVRRVAPKSATTRTGGSSHSMLSRTPIVVVNDAELRATSLDGRSGFLVSLIDGVTSVESLIDLSGMPAEQTLAILEDLRLRRIVDLS
jgi:hypothetical protein